MQTALKVIAFSLLLTFSLQNRQLNALTTTKFFSDNDGIIDNEGLVIKDNTLTPAFNVLPDNDSNIIGCWRLDESTGNTVSDSKGIHDGTRQNMEDSDWVQGIFSNALAFDGVDESVVISDHVDLDGFAQFSLECWAKPQTNALSEQRLTVFYTMDDNDSSSTVIEGINGTNGIFYSNGSASNTDQHDNEGQVNGCLEFDGVDDYIDCGNVGDIEGDISLAAWVYLPNLNASSDLSEPKCILGKNSTGCYRLRINPDGKIWLLLNDGGVYDIIIPDNEDSKIKFNKWEHVAVTVNFDSHDVKFYINGEFKETKTTVKTCIASSYVPLVIGKDWTGATSQLWTGCLDDIRLYNYTLSSREVASLYNNGNGTDSDLVSKGIISKYDGNDGSYILAMNYDIPQPIAYVDNDSVISESYDSSALSINEWQHLALTYDNDSVKLFINGTIASQTGSLNGSMASSTADLRFGISDGSCYWSGVLDEVFLRNTALSETEIQAHAKVFKSSCFVIGKLLDSTDCVGRFNSIVIDVAGLDENHKAFLSFSTDNVNYYNNDGTVADKGIELINGQQSINFTLDWSQESFFYKIILENYELGYSENNISITSLSLDYSLDSDMDGLLDDDEVNIYNTNPLVSDSDDDGLTDGEEVNIYNTAPDDSDTDDDGLNDWEEINGQVGVSMAQEFKVNENTIGNQKRPYLTANGNNYFVIWEDWNIDATQFGVYGQLINENGSFIGTSTEISSASSIKAQYLAAASDDTNYLVLWENDETDIYAQFFDSVGNEVGSSFVVDNQSSEDLYPAIACNGESYLVVWSKLAGICKTYGRLFNTQGTALTGEMQISSSSIYSQYTACVASDGTNYLAIWRSEGQDGSYAGIYAQLIDNSGNKIGSEIQINTYTLNNQKSPDVASNGTNYLVVWASEKSEGYDISGQFLDLSGNKIGSEFQLNTYTLNDQSGPCIRSDGNNYLVIWGTDGQDGDGYGIFGQFFDQEGNTLGVEFHVSDHTMNNQSYPTLYSNGINYLVAWHSEEQDGNGYGVYSRLIELCYGTNPLVADTDGDGLTDGEEINIYNTDPLDSDSDDDGLTDGEEVNTYHTDPNDTDSDDDELTDEEEVNTYHTNPNNPDTDDDELTDEEELNSYNTNPLVSDTDDDGLSDSIEVSRSILTQEVKVNENTIGNQKRPYLTANGNNYFVIWEDWNIDATQFAVSGQLINENGSFTGTSTEISSASSIKTQYLAAASDDTNYLVLWENDEVDIYAQFFDSVGNEVGLSFVVDDPSSVDLYPVIACNGESYLVVWSKLEGRCKTYGRLFNTQGTALTGEMQISSSSIYSQYTACVASDGTNYLAVWRSEGQDGSYAGIYAQLIDNSGNKIGSEIQINTYTLNNQRSPNVFSNGTNYLVVWASEKSEGYDISGQFLDLSGNKIGSEFQVNTYTLNDQKGPCVGSDGNNYLVIWETDRQDGDGYGIYGQFFDQEGNTLGVEFHVSDYIMNNQSYPTLYSNGINYLAAWHSGEQDGNGYGVYSRLIELCEGEGTDPLVPDTDADGLIDGEEINIYNTDPLDSDSDDDGLTDGDEVSNNTNPLDSDTDGDGLTDLTEVNNELYDPISPNKEYNNTTFNPVNDANFESLNCYRLSPDLLQITGVISNTVNAPIAIKIDAGVDNDNNGEGDSPDKIFINTNYHFSFLINTDNANISDNMLTLQISNVGNAGSSYYHVCSILPITSNNLKILSPQNGATISIKE